MYSRISGFAAIVLLVAFQCGCQTTKGDEDGSGSSVTSNHDGIDLTLSAESTEVLLGEAILLQLVLKNTGKEPLFVWGKQDTYSRILPFVKRANDNRYRIAHISAPMPTLETSKDELAPGEEAHYELRMVSDGPTIEFVFSTAGEYLIKLQYPLSNDGTSSIETGELKVRIKTPEGEDAVVLDRINEETTRIFLQHGSAAPAKVEQCVTTLAETLIEYPDTRYRRTIEWALRQYYPTAELRPEMAQLLRKALGTDP